MNWKNESRQEEKYTNQALMLVAFPELEGSSFGSWARSVARFLLTPIRRGIENLIVDTSELIRHLFHPPRN
jgi:hypothetical protein